LIPGSVDPVYVGVVPVGLGGFAVFLGLLAILQGTFQVASGLTLVGAIVPLVGAVIALMCTIVAATRLAVPLNAACGPRVPIIRLVGLRPSRFGGSAHSRTLRHPTHLHEC
jgi:hypothetical protein